MPETALTEPELYERMAAYIDEHGWTQHRYENAQGKVCLMGAAERVYSAAERVYSSRSFDPSFDGLRSVIRDEYIERLTDRTGISIIVDFNDHPDTTVEDVMVVLRKAAVR